MILNRHAEFFSDGHHQQFARAFGSLNRRVAGHQSHAARIAAEIDRRQIRVSRDDANVERIDAENFSDDVSENRIRALADIGRAAHHANAALPIEPQLHARLRHVVPVDRQARAADVRTASDADSFAVRQLAIVLRPSPKTCSSNPNLRQLCRCTGPGPCCRCADSSRSPSSALTRCRRRIAAGSSFNCSAILSS